MKMPLTCPNGPYELDIRYRGNKILSASSSFGYCERNILKQIKNTSALKTLPFIERIDPYSSQHYSLCFCSIMEQALSIREGKKLSTIRTILLELERVLSHAYYIKTVIKSSENIALYNLIVGIKDALLDILEEITGRRIYVTAHYFGGLNFNVSHGNIKLIETTCLKIKADLKMFYEIFFDNPSLRSVLEDEAIIDHKTSSKMTGPFSWMNSETIKDLRVTDPYMGYQDNEVRKILSKKFKSPTNDIYARLLIIIDDAMNSLDVINTLVSKDDIVYINSDRLEDNFSTKEGEYSYTIEAPRGLLTMTASIGENSVIEKLSIKNPSSVNDIAVNNALNGCRLEQADLAFKSLYLSPMEIDK
jgi:NADH-quinone oxidoreductase subunit D